MRQPKSQIENIVVRYGQNILEASKTLQESHSLSKQAKTLWLLLLGIGDRSEISLDISTFEAHLHELVTQKYLTAFNFTFVDTKKVPKIEYTLRSPADPE